jgi:hypothetical protein
MHVPRQPHRGLDREYRGLLCTFRPVYDNLLHVETELHLASFQHVDSQAAGTLSGRAAGITRGARRQHQAVGIQALYRGNVCRPVQEHGEEVDAGDGIVRRGDEHVAPFAHFRLKPQPLYSRIGSDNYPEGALVGSPEVDVE